MKIREVLVEKTELTKSQRSAIPNASSVGVPGLPMGPTNFYHKYRLGVAMAGSPDDEHDYPTSGQFADDMVMIGYSDADNEIIDAANKKFGYTQKNVGKGKSKETDDTGKISPVAQWNKKK
jgi:hypothetical protein